MIEEPYRWLEAVANRRDYVREQLKGGSPVLGVSLAEGILLLGVGTGQTKVFELFDRHALAGLGHPADIERIRQAAIDAAHMEAFTRAPEDVSLRRLVAFGLSPQLKTNFEQIFSAPYLLEVLLAELGLERGDDLLIRLHFDGSFQSVQGGISVVASQPEPETAAVKWLSGQINETTGREQASRLLLEAWWCLTENKAFDETIPKEEERQRGWKESTRDKVIELGWLARTSPRHARYETLSVSQLKLT
jgi:proteasome alpha subunit